VVPYGLHGDAVHVFVSWALPHGFIEIDEVTLAEATLLLGNFPVNVDLPLRSDDVGAD